MPDFLDLPPHVLEYVLSCLGKDRRTLLRCRLVCRQINAMIFSPELDFLWEHLELNLHRDSDTALATRHVKALSYLQFLHNVAGYVKHLKIRKFSASFLFVFQIPITALQSLPTLSALTTLDLSQNDLLTTQQLQEFAMRSSSVSNINLSCCESLDDTAFVVMTNNWTNMESINISGCRSMNDRNGRMSEFHDSLSSVKKYNFESIVDVYDSTILRLINRDGVADKLVELRISACNVTDASFLAIGSCLKLQFFSAKDCVVLTDASLQSLKNLVALTHLHLHSSWFRRRDFTTTGLLELFKEAHFQLQHLSLGSLPGLNDATVEHIVRRNPGLKTLSIYNCPNMTDTGLAYVKELTELRLFDCSRMRSVDGSFLDFDPRRLPSLRFINMMDSGVSEATSNAIRDRFGHVLVAVANNWTDCDREACVSLLRTLLLFFSPNEGGCCMHMDIS